ncbi:phycobilisome linker polypeptide [Oculatella sp. LEGE 06141]|uniref:phycobilisome linker polypeptide n=1 Tax=Oculatella sp. LEGE 06141 TaxID=1828648 RepID=UPI00187F9F21|nr:phycobilisome linker polypeptide [Oculatella sp. LEGE 06141]MBE9182141.1 phycobilisome linker polypeptide [Oculatella sp. LEGE 06141]
MSGLVAANLAAAGRLGVSAFDQTTVELRPDWTEDDVQLVIRAAYRQVLGNDYVMESERLTNPESQLRRGNITVRDFVRAIAKSELYKNKFLYRNSNTRFIELSYKHLLGRAPYEESEVNYHLNIYNEKGYDAEIDSYIDSVEYEQNFGNNVVPYYRGFSVDPGVRTTGFTRMFRLYRGYASSDRGQAAGRSPHVFRELAQNRASTIIKPTTSGSMGGFHGAGSSDTPNKALGGSYGEAGRIYRLEVAGIREPGYPRVRRSNKAFLVPVEQMLPKMQQIHRMGGRIVSVSPA